VHDDVSTETAERQRSCPADTTRRPGHEHLLAGAVDGLDTCEFLRAVTHYHSQGLDGQNLTCFL
jgi:hypothetical protein